MALFTMQSTAEIITSDGIIVDSQKALSLVTKLRPREPPGISQGMTSARTVGKITTYWRIKTTFLKEILSQKCPIF